MRQLPILVASDDKSMARMIITHIVDEAHIALIIRLNLTPIRKIILKLYLSWDHPTEIYIMVPVT